MRQLVPRAKRDPAERATPRRDDASHPTDTTRRTGVATFLRRACAVFLGIMTHAFLLNVPHPPTFALGVAYAVSAACLAVAAWRLWWPTMR